MNRIEDRIHESCPKTPDPEPRLRRIEDRLRQDMAAPPPFGGLRPQIHMLAIAACVAVLVVMLSCGHAFLNRMGQPVRSDAGQLYGWAPRGPYPRAMRIPFTEWNRYFLPRVQTISLSGLKHMPNAPDRHLSD